ncbi:MAG: methylisocitrate lyase [Planctomycetaceae bacterium]
MNSTSPSPGATLKATWSNRTLLIPGVFNALVARMAERAGFQAVYQSGAALSAGLAALPDVGLISQTEFADQARYLTQAVSIPVISDADTGFGEALSVERTVSLFEAAGLAGLHLEDQQFPKRCGHLSGKTVVDPQVMCAKIRAAVNARHDPDFVIIARTDARAVHGIQDSLDRAKAYVDAGADAIFPEALESAEEFERFADTINVPLIANMTEFGKSPLLNVGELQAMGYVAVLYPVTLFRLAMRTVESALQTLQAEGSQQSLIEQMQTRAELYELLNYDDYEKRDRDDFQ